ncbi:DUF6371 domain-containing protein [Mucilaginibacter sp. OK098]|uniref:DUF6371 domain-containing protein n=1 Tax=Mucilaginibacter sp. OK098 TaxID=1855297 RepID=UPI0009172C7C|nr:DUF6371 domain-containing protein [Mucilaginibacter sp. OK098]SHN30528.1 hypothetical protein SAMN05216524_10944 [Mucilaginibacter sp. OK098]
MTTPHRYTLEPYRGSKTRYHCPECNQRSRTFTRYIDTQTGDHLADHVGKCDRLDQCGYHYKPRDFFKANPGAYKPSNNNSFNMLPTTKYFDTIPPSIVEGTMRGYDKNVFTMFLAEMFGAEQAIALIEKYKIGCAKHWPGATVFWQIDANDKVRTGKVMLYGGKDCRRIKQPFNHIAWVHRLLRAKPDKGQLSAVKLDYLPQASDYQLKQCLFGEHLLSLEPFKTVAITESEKTAIIASVYYPNYIWLAAGSLEGLSVDKCQVLKDRTVRLYPDINGYAKWHSKARELNARIPSATFVVDERLLHNASDQDRLSGIDIADKWIDEKLLEWELEKELERSKGK